MDDILLCLGFLFFSFIVALTLCFGINHSLEESNIEYKKILKKEFGQVFPAYEDYVLYKIKDYNLKVEGGY